GRQSRGDPRAAHQDRRSPARPRRSLRPLRPRATRRRGRYHAPSGRVVARMDADVGFESALSGARAAISGARDARVRSARHGCDGWKTPSGPPASIDAELRQSLGGWSVVPIGATPVQAAALVDLGQALMFDKVLSGNRDIACATCHNPVTHAADGLALSVGTG